MSGGVLAAGIANAEVGFERVIPVLRIFDEAKAREFYLDYLGCTVDWEHRFEPGTPIYMQVSRGNLVFHLSEHVGDGTPGSAVFVRTDGLDAFHAELTARRYKYYRPGIQAQSWGVREMTVTDPFGNRLTFAEPIVVGSA
ncbi:MAG TPA: glyoxalase superfamily protein [Bauldia sp.]|nr:glyoxalase superfamily protein [Bauldia sp.]